MDPQKPLTGLNEFGGKKVSVELKNATKMVGVLKAFDYNLNVLLEDSEEQTADGKTKLGTVLVRGNNINNIFLAE